VTRLGRGGDCRDDGRRPRDGEHRLFVREEECGCIRVRCEHGHSPQQIVEALGFTLDDLLSERHRRRS
jgi:hypothetical protein